MKLFLFIFSLFLTVNLSVGQESKNDSVIGTEQNLRIAVVGVDGMACQEGCADKIAMYLQNTKGVVSAEVSYEKKKAVITFDSKLTAPQILTSVITNTKVKEYVYTINTMTFKE